MKIENLKINSYGTLKEKDINLQNNLNIIFGKNESGKSTLLSYIKNIFYGISKNKNGKEISDYEKYTPWIGEEFSGKVKYELDNGEEYEVYRDFHKKNVKVFDANLDDISSQYKIDKKDGNQFFIDQTGVDEKTYTTTIMSLQQEVVLDNSSQNILVQRIANLAGTGEDKVSFQKAIDKLNKRQLEEIGTTRTQDRPINIVQKRMKEIEIVLKAENNELENKQNLEVNKNEICQRLDEQKEKVNIIKKLNAMVQKHQISLEKDMLKQKIQNENKEKLKRLQEQKNNLLKDNNQMKENFTNYKIEEDIEKNNSKEIKNNVSEIGENLEIKKYNLEKNRMNRKIKNINIVFILILILLIVINIFNFKIIYNKIINYCLLSLIPIELILFIYFNFKNNKLKSEIEKNISKQELQNELQEKLKKQKLQEQISNINMQINLLEKEIEKQEKEIIEENLENDKEIKNEIEKLKEEITNVETLFLLNNFIDNLKDSKLLGEDIQKELEKSEKQMMNDRLKLNSLEYEEKNISEKIEEITSYKEEYENLKEQLEIIEEKNKCIQATKELLEKAYEKMKKNVTPKFTQNLSNLIERITQGKYKKVNTNEEKGLIVELENGEYIPASLLSIGTIDQMYLSLRLAMVDEISKEKMPIILDEAFAYFDDERLKNSLLFLIEQAKEHQIILFTCTKREKEIIDSLGISYNWVEI